MPVVINEFEILTEPPPPAEPDGSPPASSPPASPTPHDIDRALRRRFERLERIRAH